MSESLFNYAKDFVDGSFRAATFSDQYIKRWKQERDDGTLLDDSPRISEKLSSIFCLADLFNPENDREEYELDEVGLRRKVSEIIAE